MSILESIEREANDIADLRSSEIIEKVISMLSRIEIPKQVYCPKKADLGAYVHSKISLTRAKRSFNMGFISENRINTLKIEVHKNRERYYERECKCGNCKETKPIT